MNEVSGYAYLNLPAVLNRESLNRWIRSRPHESALPASLPEPLLKAVASSFAEEQNFAVRDYDPLDVSFSSSEKGALPLVLVLHILRKRFKVESLLGVGLNSRMLLDLLRAYRLAVEGEIQSRRLGSGDRFEQELFMDLIDATPLIGACSG